MNSAMPTALTSLGFDPRVCSSEKFLKLPKWAQEYIKDLEREKANAQRLLSEFIDTQTPSDYYVTEWTKDGLIKHYIQGSSVTVRMGPQQAVSVHKRSDGQLDISTEYGGMLIHPSASNSIKITVKD